MLREPDSDYFFGRDKSLLKYKKYFDDEAEIIGTIKGFIYF
jgi:ATP-dependent DNA ligase